MQNNRVWERACGLIRTVVEGVRFDDTATAIVVSVRPVRGRGVVVDGAAVDHRAMTPATAGDVGGLSMRARPKCLSRLMLPESGAAPMDRLFWLFVEPIGINTDLPPLRMILSV